MGSFSDRSAGSRGAGMYASGSSRGSRSGSDGGSGDDNDEGLFRRVDRVRGEMKSDFLDGLIADAGGVGGQRSSTPVPTRDRAHYESDGGGGGDGEGTFLSDLLSSQVEDAAATGSGARQRRSARRGTSGGSETSSLTTPTVLHAGASDDAGADGEDAKYHRRGGPAAGGEDSLASIIERSSVVRQARRLVERVRSEVGRLKDSDLIGRVREADVAVRLRRFYSEGGEVMPKNAKEWVMLAIAALLLSPILHVAVMYSMGTTR